jgi:scyllo-inositol 2-dehydrogenase (NADP+)
MAQLRVAVIGYGLSGAIFHAPLIASTEGLAVATVVTGNPQRQDRVRRDHPAARVAASAEDLWELASEHDLVVIAAPNDAHAPLARKALQLGLPVVVDKPLAPTSAEARALVREAGELGLLLTVFQNRRWDSDQLTLRRLLSDGDLGEVIRFESRFERWRPQLPALPAWRETATPAQGGGVLLDLGSHLVDQALVLFGAATHVYGEVDSRRGAADDDAFLAVHHASGARSHLWASALAGAPGPRLRVLGTRAAYTVKELDGQEEALRSGSRPAGGAGWGVEPQSHWGRLFEGERSEDVPSEPGAWPEFYASLVRTIRDGAPPPVDPSDAVATLEVLEAARDSADSGMVVEMPASR